MLLLYSCVSLLHYYWNLSLNWHLVSGTPVGGWFNTVKEKVENSDFQCVARALISFFFRIVAFLRILRFEFWRRQNNVRPSNLTEHSMNSHPPAVEAANEEDRVLPCLERLQRLEKEFEELSCKPAEIPLEKEQILVESLDRIKSVEADLEQTKRVWFVLCDLFMWKWNFDCIDGDIFCYHVATGTTFYSGETTRDCWFAREIKRVRPSCKYQSCIFFFFSLY